MLLAMVLLLFLLAVPYEHATVLKNTAKKVKIIHSSLMLFSLCVLILYSLQIPVWSPAKPISELIEAIFKLKG